MGADDAILAAYAAMCKRLVGGRLTRKLFSEVPSVCSRSVPLRHSVAIRARVRRRPAVVRLVSRVLAPCADLAGSRARDTESPRRTAHPRPGATDDHLRSTVFADRRTPTGCTHRWGRSNRPERVRGEWLPERGKRSRRVHGQRTARGCGQSAPWSGRSAKRFHGRRSHSGQGRPRHRRGVADTGESAFRWAIPSWKWRRCCGRGGGFTTRSDDRSARGPAAGGRSGSGERKRSWSGCPSARSTACAMLSPGRAVQKCEPRRTREARHHSRSWARHVGHHHRPQLGGRGCRRNRELPGAISARVATRRFRCPYRPAAQLHQRGTLGVRVRIRTLASARRGERPTD